MNIFRLSRILGIMIAIAAIQLYSANPVPGAAYAELQGDGKCYRVYKHLSTTNKPKLLSKIFDASTIKFYDQQGKLLLTEKGAVDDLAVKNSQLRLTELPLAHRIELHSIKAPGNQYVEVFDRQGHHIASVHKFRKYSSDGRPAEREKDEPIVDRWTQLKHGDALPASAHAVLKQFVANQEQLKNMRIEAVFSNGFRKK